MGEEPPPEMADNEDDEEGERSGPSLLSNHMEPEDWERASHRDRPLVFGVFIAIATVCVAAATVVYVAIEKLKRRAK